MLQPAINVPSALPRAGKMTIQKALHNIQIETSNAHKITVQIENSTSTCNICNNFGWYRVDVAVGQPGFGQLKPCPTCTVPKIEAAKKALIYGGGEEPDLSTYTFDNFNTNSNSINTSASLKSALTACKHFASDPRGWLLIAGPYGCGKSHLAAAIANATRLPAIFVTMPDLLDQLRAGFEDKVYDYEDRMDRVRSIPVLVIDDLGAEKSTDWAKEKLFQVINYRYMASAPTVLTTNVTPDGIDGRIYSRMADYRLTVKVIIDAPDYRRTKRG